ncbi:uncharacterized protein G2W53_019117 [Senna tora]|uniref:DOCKER domain-containing protein n=1 Tax=Senna tora TaxID=362788 RepID=A0A834TT20_9FABA|nr:uncharacterized protein G2W53_019117 [Senna tora]
MGGFPEVPKKETYVYDHLKASTFCARITNDFPKATFFSRVP